MKDIDESRRNFLKLVGVASGASIVSTSFIANIIDWFMKGQEGNIFQEKRSKDPENPGNGEAWIREDLI